jgi:hypothetical protein
MKKQLKKAGKKLDHVHQRIRDLSRRVNEIRKTRADSLKLPVDKNASIDKLEKYVKKALTEAKDAEDKAAWEAIIEVNRELEDIKREMDAATRDIKRSAAQAGVPISSIMPRPKIQDLFDLSGRRKFKDLISDGNSPEDPELSRAIAGMSKSNRERLEGFTKKTVPKDWPNNIPYPVIWRRSGGGNLVNHKGKSTEEMLDSLKQTFESLGIDYTHGDMAETMIDNYLINRECRTFCFSERLLEALQETPLGEIPTELIKLPVPLVYFDFSELNLTYEAGGQKLEWRGCFLTMTDWCLMFMTVSHVLGDSDTPYAFSVDPCEIPDEEMFEPAIVDDHGSGFPEFFAEKLDVFKLAISALLYVNSVNADLKEEWLAKNTAAKMKGAKGRRKRDLKRHLQEMGKVTRAGYYLYIPTAPAEQGEPGTGRKIGIRFLCRGHWRRYWTGPRKGIQKPVMKWIAPHWKGPEAADQIHEKMFIVDTPPRERSK